MTNLKRYVLETMNSGACMEEDQQGAWVRYDDIKHLLQVEPSGDWQVRLAESMPSPTFVESDPIVTCPACLLGFRVSASSPPTKNRFK